MHFYLQRIDIFRPRKTMVTLVDPESRAGRLAASIAKRCDAFLAKHPPRSPNGRVVLSAQPYAESKALDNVEARSWLEAKRTLGFPLTVRQELILHRRRQAA